MKWLSSKPKIKVFITKTKKFRASIKEPGKPRYEVTIGGKKWKNGCGTEHQIVIFEKLAKLMGVMEGEFHRLQDERFN